ncbi:TPA: tryptophan--tRNA ligase [Candidatus Dependentiae bacterium]|nr:MAG: Tryptophan-tRNA ligase [candidate division TM6 bacterium GW2011_GWE2_31_21]KKP53689.1 MAG: Tryptophan-tRNA ligase [candidate division TM6 bacterium GW2011_GWF2_33_332]HBS48559.1 tryptophan--tRNA ligase [Candidatus Dependentiae bacterium]HBZ73174.1 tryptophan--tRNA ligase [Candidatus Dependentiae bacterium]
MSKKVILTGDRPTGQLHLGHYIGSLQNRVKLQDEYDQYILIADLQALTDNAENPQKIRDSIFEVVLDYLAVGIDPNKSTIFIQSKIPQISDLTIYYLNLVTVARLQRNPTVKEEIKQKGFEESLPVGFFCYPISQAADITAFKANLVPVGEDQLPMIEQTNEIVRKFNSVYAPVLVEAKALVPKFGCRLPGIDGKAKMGKSLGNAIYLADSVDVVTKKVMGMYTDPNHLKVSDPGLVEGNPVFTYLDAFDTNKDKVEELKAHYSRGGLGDVIVKKYLNEVLQNVLEPIRKKREGFAKDKEFVLNVLKNGTAKAESVADKTLKEVQAAMKIDYF